MASLNGSCKEKCVVCDKDDVMEEMKMKWIGCCYKPIHSLCVDKCYTICPVCKGRLQILNEIKRSDKFTGEEASIIEEAFLIHYDLYVKPKPVTITRYESKFVRRALKSEPLKAMDSVTNRIYNVCLVFLFDVGAKDL